MLKPDHRLDDRLRLSHLRRRRRRRTKRCPFIDGTATHELYVPQATEATSTINCPKKSFWRPLFGDPSPKDIATKSGETHVRDRALPSCKFSRRSARVILSPGKNDMFPYRGLPCGAICRVLSLSDRRYSLNPLSQTRID